MVIQLYQESVDILTSQGKFYINLGLERVQNFLNLIGNPQDKLKYIHVAGTNGKGSVCSMLSSILAENNFKTGLFTSPHVFEYTERIKIDNVDIGKDIFAQKTLDITELAQKNGIHLTEFEILTIVAFQYFAENNVDIVVLETGLGGRLDATNVIKAPLCSVITHIDFDHTERLGDTIEKIASEKAGIIKENCPVVIGGENFGIQVINKVAKEKNCEIFAVKNVDLPKYGLKGTYQRENLALVLKAVEILQKNGFNVTQLSIESGLKNVKHPCRFEYIAGENMIIDGAHNPNGTKALRDSLNFYYPNQSFKFIFGCLKNKNHQVMMKNLFTQRDEIYFYHFNYQNACSYEELSNECEFESKPFSEFKKDSETLTVICGSFYMIKELLTKMGIK